MRYILLAFVLKCSLGFSQDSLQLIILSEKVGEVIDLSEKKEYFLFPYFGSKTFESAWLFKSENGEIILHARMTNGKVKLRVMTDKDIETAMIKLGEPHVHVFCLAKKLKAGSMTNAKNMKKAGTIALISGPIIIGGGIILTEGLYIGGRRVFRGNLNLSIGATAGFLAFGAILIPIGIGMLIEASSIKKRIKKHEKETSIPN